MPSPLGIRRRLKSLLGLGGNEKSSEGREETPKVTVTLVAPSGEECTGKADAGATIVFATGRLKRSLATGCSDSTCSTCRVDVLEGAENLSPKDEREEATLKANGRPDTMRLGCRTEIVKGSVKVRAYEVV
jgi:ferredoxin